MPYTESLKQLKLNFPGLESCQIISYDHPPEPSKYEEANNWLNWVAYKNPELKWLRIKLNDSDLQLIIKRLDDKHLLAIINQKEGIPLLLSYLKGLTLVTQIADGSEKSEKPKKSEEIDLKIQDAVRIQKLIIPRAEDISKNFRNFFVVHQQQDIVGGDFYWFNQTDNCLLIALVDCTGHSVEGAMTSMVCNSLLNQAFSNFSPGHLSDFVKDFYRLLNQYNQTAEDMMDYGIGAELGVFSFDYQSQEISFISTGVSAFIRSDKEVKVIKMRKMMDYSLVHKYVQEVKLSMKDVKELYTFTDGLTDQFDSSDKKKLGLKGVRRIIEQEETFASEYYSSQINEWMGNNMQYDDITLMGIAI
jgi:serine phosphatase RsbU (regulator of sigma subunit)